MSLDDLRTVGADLEAVRKELTAEIADALHKEGYFLRHLAPLPEQAMVDVRWAAQAAGRAVGRRVHSHTSAVSQYVPGKITLLITPERHSEDGLSGYALDLVERLLGVGKRE